MAESSNIDAIIDQLCSRLSESWNRGARTRIEALIQSAGMELPDEAVLKLILSEYNLRKEFNDSPSLEEYSKRFPQLQDRLARLLLPDQSLEATYVGPQADSVISKGDQDQSFLFGDDQSPRAALETRQTEEKVRPIEQQSRTIIGEREQLPGEKPSQTAIGDYDLLRELARGGMGVVFLARQRRLNRLVALKMILSGTLASEQDVKRFHTEAESAAKLEHVGIVPIYEVGEVDGQHYYSMGYVDGPSLSQRLHEGPLSSRDAAELMIAIADAVQYAHDRGVIHRDLKPANVLLAASPSIGSSASGSDSKTGSAARSKSGVVANQRSSSGTGSGRQRDARSKLNLVPKITDFGLAKQMSEDRSGVTASGAVIGTPSYMSPEQAAGRTNEVNASTDIYALGAILYEILTGRPPFRAPSIVQTLKQVIEQEPVKPRLIDSQINRDLETICLKCLEKSPHRRYATAADMADDLRRFINDEPVRARPVGLPMRLWRWCRRNPYLVGSISAAVFAVGAISVALSARQAADRATRLQEFQQAVASGLDSLTLEPESYQQLDSSLATMELFDARAAAEARNKLRERFINVIEKKINQPKIDDEAMKQIDYALARLTRIDGNSAERLQKLFNGRLGGWEPYAEVVAPFARLDDVFHRGHVTVDSQRLVPVQRPREKTVDGIPLTERPLETRVLAESSLRCEVTFGEDWETAQQLGLDFGEPGKALSFRLSVPQTSVRQLPDDILAAQTKTEATDAPQRTFQIARTEATDVWLEIRRGPTLLQRREVAASALRPGPLTMICERDGTNLSMQVNELPRIRFDDMLPPPTVGRPLYLDWPNSVSLTTLRLFKRLQDSSRGPLAEADDFFVAGRFSESEPLYLAASRGDVSAIVRREVLFKRALCLISLQRENEAAELLEQLSDNAIDRWSPAAGCQLLLLRIAQRQMDKADLVLEELQARYTPEQLSRLVSTDIRDNLVREISDSLVRVDRLMRFDPDRLNACKRLATIDRLLSHDGRGNPVVLFIVIKGYRFENRLEDALRLCEEAVNTDSSPLNATTTIEYVRLLRQLGRPQEAIAKIQQWQAANPKAMPFSLFPIELARSLVAIESWEEAESTLQQFFETDVNDIHPTTFLQASLLKGVLLERRGKLEEANQVWLNAYLHVKQPKYRISHVTDTGFLIQVILGGLTDQPLAAESEKLFSAIGSFGSFATLFRATVNPASVESAIRNCWRRPNAKPWIEEFAYGNASMRDVVRMPIVFCATEFAARNAFAEAYDRDETQIIQQVAEKFIQGIFFENTIGSNQVVQLGLAWKGNLGVFGWKSLSPMLPENIRASCAFVLAHRAVRQNQVDAAIELLNQAAQPNPDRELLSRLAARDRDLLQSKQGLLRIVTAADSPVDLVLEGADQSTRTVTVTRLQEMPLPVGNYKLRPPADALMNTPIDVEVSLMTRTEVAVNPAPGQIGTSE